MFVRPEASSARSLAVLDRLAAIIELVTGHPSDQVRPEHTFVDDLRIDSLAMAEILEGAAQALGVPIQDEAAKDFIRVGDLVDYLDARGVSL